MKRNLKRELFRVNAQEGMHDGNITQTHWDETGTLVGILLVIRF